MYVFERFIFPASSFVIFIFCDGWRRKSVDGSDWNYFYGTRIGRTGRRNQRI